jgi:NAD(P)-dependent dehydrogenase (short-subunit alcohol dehydrogenase family)
MRHIADRHVIVTGASGGLGRAVALAFAREGARLGLIARTAQGLDSAKAECGQAGAKDIFTAAADMAKPEEAAQAAAQLEAALGGFDIWINNAMETVFARVDTMTPEEYRRVTEVNYLGYVYGTLEALKRMQPKNGGHIIQIGSALAYRSIPLQSAYCATKFAIRGFTDSLRCELIHNRQDIALTIVHMPALNTPQFSWARTHEPRQPMPVGTIFQPEVGAQAVLHAARYPKREYWVGGSTVAAIIGTLFLPGWMDRKMAKMTYDQQWVPGETIPPREGNLFTPGDNALHRTHGRFDAKAKHRSLTWELIARLSRIGRHS